MSRITDTQRLDFLSANGGYQTSCGWDEERPWTVHNVTGGPNDREWHEIGRGDTLREAIDAAMAHQAGVSGGA